MSEDHKLTVLRNNDPSQGGSSWRGEIIKQARMIGDHETEAVPLVGFFMIGYFSDGSHSTGHRYDAVKCAIPRRLMPAYVAEIVREEMITLPEAGQQTCDILNDGPQ